MEQHDDIKRLKVREKRRQRRRSPMTTKDALVLDDIRAVLAEVAGDDTLRGLLVAAVDSSGEARIKSVGLGTVQRLGLIEALLAWSDRQDG